MPQSLTKILSKIESQDPKRGRRLRNFYEGARNKITLDMLDTGSWRRAIEILDQYERTGHVLRQYEVLVDMYEVWNEEE